MKEGRIPEYPEETVDDELQKMPHKARNSSPNQDSNPHSSIGGRQGKQTRSQLHHTSPHYYNNSTCCDTEIEVQVIQP